MLVCGRPELTERAVRCFDSQIYEPKELIEYRNNGDRPIGALRNAANAQATGEIICHFDSDDWSHPNRIAEQVAFLESSGADVVGYNEMLFWREPRAFGTALVTPLNGEAWLYSYGPPKPTLGTSLCYWRKTWERKPFRNDLPRNGESTGEDWEFIQGLKVVACSSLIGPELFATRVRMIARIHGGNSVKYNLEDANGTCWSRAPEWDHRVKELLG